AQLVHEDPPRAPIHLRLRAGPRLDAPDRPDRRLRRAAPHEAHHRLVRTNVTVLADQRLVEALDALRPARRALPVLPLDPRLDHAFEGRARLRLLRAAIHRARRAALEAVTQRALVHPEFLGDTADTPALTHEHLRAHQLPLRQLRHARLPSTRNVPEIASGQCGKVAVR